MKKYKIIRNILFLIFSLFFIFYFLTITPNNEIRKEIELKALELQTEENIHNYLWSSNNYSYYYFPQNINKYWIERNGDCSEIAIIKKIMFNSLGFKSYFKITYPNGNKHIDVIKRK